MAPAQTTPKAKEPSAVRITATAPSSFGMNTTASGYVKRRTVNAHLRYVCREIPAHVRY